jgi:hypothetical protein
MTLKERIRQSETRIFKAVFPTKSCENQTVTDATDTYNNRVVFQLSATGLADD